MTSELRKLQEILDFQKIQTEMIKAMVKEGWNIQTAIEAVVF